MSLFRDIPKVNLTNVIFNNNFSFSEGRDVYVTGESVNAYFNQIFLTGGRDERWKDDIKPSFMLLSKIQANINDFYVKDYYSNGTIINIEQAYGTIINNISIEDSIFDGILESQCDIDISNLKIKNSISQGGYADKKSLPAFNIKMNSITITDSEIDGFSCKSTVFNVQSYGQLKIRNTSFKDLYAKETIITRSYIGAKTEDPSPLIIDNCSFNGVSSSSSMLSLETGAGCTITSSTFENIGFCPKDGSVKNCEKTDTGSFASLIHTSILDIKDTTIKNSEAVNGGLFFIKHEPKLYLTNVTVTDSHATEYGGVFWFGDFGGKLSINDCIFNKCQAVKGGVIAISRNSHLVRDESWNTNFTISFNNCEFIENTAEYGGVYFIGENSNSHGISFEESLFKNNFADAGGIGVCINATTNPKLGNYKSVNNSAKYYADEFGYQPNQIDLLSVIAAHSSEDNPLYSIVDNNSTFYFPKQANIEFAKNFSVKYGNFTKTVKVGDEEFLLIQSGASDLIDISKDFDDKHIINIPVSSVGVFDRSVIPYIELLEKRSTIGWYKDTKTTTSPCVNKMFSQEIIVYETEKPDSLVSQLSSANIVFGKIDYDIPNKPENIYRNVPFNAISEESPLARAEWIKYVALFYNEEKLADDLFNILKDDYNELQRIVEEKKTSDISTRTIAWVSFNGNKWTYHTDNFYKSLTRNAGGKIFSPSSTDGDFTNVIKNGDVDFIIDISENNINDDLESFLNNSGLRNKCDEYNYCKNNNIFKFDKVINEYKYSVWNEHLLPMANTLLIELQLILLPEVFKEREEINIWYHTTYLRKLDEAQTVISAEDCYGINSSVIFERYATTEDLDIQTFSGDWIPYSFMLGIKTYNGTNFKAKHDENSTDGALFVTVTIVDRNNTSIQSKNSTIYGKKRWRCNLANSTCSIPANEFQVIGDDGEYTLNFTIIENENWQFDTLINAYASVDITINQCKRKKYSDITNTYFKSCYEPDCPGDCIHGKCEDLNYCRCDEDWEGLNCNDMKKFEVPLWLQYMFLIVGITSAILCCILIIMLYLRRNLQHVRSSSPLFLMIMTIGAVCNSVTIIFESRNNSIAICILREWFKYIGFSLMVGALIVKTIRISLIFSGKKIGGSQLADKRLIVYLFGILIPFIILLIIWSTVDKGSLIPEKHSNRAFKKCSGHTTSIIGDVFLFAILFWAVHAAYTARNAPSAFNETKAIVLSTYVYFIIEVLVIVLQNLGSFDPAVSMTINCLAILVSTWCCLLFILKPKMKNVTPQMTPSQYSSTSQSQSEAYNSTIGTQSMGTTSVGVKSGRL